MPVLSALVSERLVPDGHDVVCLDNFFTGTKKNICHLLDHPTSHPHDITQPMLLEVDWIFNLACPASPSITSTIRSRLPRSTVLGALHVLGLQRGSGRGDAGIHERSLRRPEVHPQIEEYWGNVNPIGRRSCYDEGKRVAETLFFDYMRQNRVDIKVIRTTTHYQPR